MGVEVTYNDISIHAPREGSDFPRVYLDGY